MSRRLPRYDALAPIMASCGSTCSPKDFYWAVNAAYHDAEAPIYDVVHEGMFSGGRPMWSRALAHLPDSPEHLEALDIGAGTGLVGGFLASLLPERMSSITLLDPSAAMLVQARARAQAWPFKAEFVVGSFERISGQRFHVITVSSVLHHVVELEDFCESLTQHLTDDGVLITMQDPRAGAEADPLLEERKASVLRRQAKHAEHRTLPRRFAAKTARMLGLRRHPPLAAATNRRLLATGVIRRPLDMESIWAVTDFHVPGQPGGVGHGVSIENLKEWLGGMVLVDNFTYDFHGMPRSTLSTEEREFESTLWLSGDTQGAQFGSVWKRAAR